MEIQLCVIIIGYLESSSPLHIPNYFTKDECSKRNVGDKAVSEPLQKFLLPKLLQGAFIRLKPYILFPII